MPAGAESACAARHAGNRTKTKPKRHSLRTSYMISCGIRGPRDRNFATDGQCTFFHVWMAKGKYYYRIQCYRPAYIKSCDPVPLLTVLSLTHPVVVGVNLREVCQLARQLLKFGEREAA